ncbi:HNH endonuclease [Vibrio parahaemolyticus]
MDEKTNKIVVALRNLSERKSKKIQNGFEMLKANYRAEGRKITAGKLAKAAGYDNYGTGNEQYGSFAHELCNILGIEPEEIRDGKPIWTFAICDASDEKDRHGYFQWVLKEEVALALEQLEIVSPIVVANVFSELEEKKSDLDVLPQKNREATIQARLGQGIFRERLINHWEGCSVTGIDNTNLLIASHIKPWRDCNPSEALSMTNGLLLLPNIDLAFDRGFISFDKSGEIIFSPQFTQEDASALGISPSMKLRWCYPEHEKFLKYHRDNVFRFDN